MAASLLAVGLMQARAEHIWLRKIAVVDYSSGSDMSLAAHAAMFDDPDLLFLAPLQVCKESDAGKAAPSEGGQKEQASPVEDWKAQFEHAAQKIEEFHPQVLVCFLGGEAAAETTSTEAPALRVTVRVDVAWAGKWAEDLAGKCCKGRSVTISSSPETISKFVLGTVQA